jgi:hypothetical protein
MLVAARHRSPSESIATASAPFGDGIAIANSRCSEPARQADDAQHVRVLCALARLNNALGSYI